MRFSSKLLLVFLSVTTTYSFNLNNLILKEKGTSGETKYEEATKAIEQCENDLEKYVDCLYGSEKFTKRNINKKCKIYKSEKCQQFYENPFHHVPACSSIPQELQDSYKNLFMISRPSMEFFCQKNESNRHCPMVKLELSNNNSEKALMKSVKKTCESKVCSEAAINLYKVLNNAIDHEEAILNEDGKAIENNMIIMDVLKTLQSKECIKNNSKEESRADKRRKIKKIMKNVRVYL